MDETTCFTIARELLTAAYQEVRECNAYSSNFGLVLSDPEITELVACRAEMRMEQLKNLLDGFDATSDNPYRKKMLKKK